MENKQHYADDTGWGRVATFRTATTTRTEIKTNEIIIVVGEERAWEIRLSIIAILQFNNNNNNLGSICHPHKYTTHNSCRILIPRDIDSHERCGGRSKKNEVFIQGNCLNPLGDTKLLDMII